MQVLVRTPVAIRFLGLAPASGQLSIANKPDGTSQETPNRSSGMRSALSTSYSRTSHQAFDGEIPGVGSREVGQLLQLPNFFTAPA